jgi:hypothetical protein
LNSALCLSLRDYSPEKVPIISTGVILYPFREALSVAVVLVVELFYDVGEVNLE